MADFWFAECGPCGWVDKFTTEDEAITAAEDHHIREHMKGNPKKREPVTVHVQNRTENAVAAPAVVEAPAAAALPAADAQAPNQPAPDQGAAAPAKE